MRYSQLDELTIQSGSKSRPRLCAVDHAAVARSVSERIKGPFCGWYVLECDVTGFLVRRAEG